MMKNIEHLLKSNTAKVLNKRIKPTIIYDASILINILDHNIIVDLDLSNFTITEESFTKILLGCIDNHNVAFFNKMLINYSLYDIDRRVVRNALRDTNHLYIESILTLTNYDVNDLADNIGLYFAIINKRDEILKVILNQDLDWYKFENHSDYPTVCSYFKDRHEVVDRQDNINYILNKKNE
jgi:hypothetical protein